MLNSNCEIKDLLQIIVSNEVHSEYVFDQQFARQRWSEMVSAIEDQPETLLDTRKITIQDLIIFESLLEIHLPDLTLFTC